MPPRAPTGDKAFSRGCGWAAAACGELSAGGRAAGTFYRFRPAEPFGDSGIKCFEYGF